MARNGSSTRRRVQLAVEGLESRCLLATAVSSGVAPVDLITQSLVQTRNTTPTVQAPSTFSSNAELEQFLIDQAVRQWQSVFGTSVNYLLPTSPITTYSASGSSSPTTDHSKTNVQTPGVDEADLVETDGNFIYTLSDNELVIVNAQQADTLAVASRTKIEGAVFGEYLDGSRLTVISQINQFVSYPLKYLGAGSLPTRAADLRTKITVFDVSDPTAPQTVQENYLDGYYVGSRAIGNKLYVVVNNYALSLPAPEYHTTDTGGVYETEAEYRARLAGHVLDAALPHVYTGPADAAGTLTDAGLVSQATSIYKPSSPDDVYNLTSVAEFDMSANQAGAVDSLSMFSSAASTIYVSTGNLYVVTSRWSVDGTTSRIDKISLTGDHLQLVASGAVAGYVLNQFALDEYQGYLRVATTASFGLTAQSNVYVLGQDGSALKIVGRLENVAPGESVFAVRFLGDRGFLVTFRRIDPVFALDLSDPTNPHVVGELKVPGVSLYLQSLDATHLLGIGNDTDANGHITGFEISVFDVTDLAHPQQVGSYSLPSSSFGWVGSEATYDPHALSYFPEYHELALPIQDATGPVFDHGADLFVFTIDPAGTITLLGDIQHNSPIHRSLRIADRLYSVSDSEMQAHPIADPKTLLARVELQSAAISAQGTNFTATADTPVDAIVATFTLLDPSWPPPYPYYYLLGGPALSLPVYQPGPATATINWGDGSDFSFGWPSKNGDGVWEIHASHVYHASGTFSVTVSLRDYKSITTTVHSTATVGDDASRKYVDQIYRDLLKRDVDAGGSAYWGSALNQGMSRAQLVQHIQNTDEYRGIEIDGVFQQLLKRHVDDGGRTYFNGFLAGGGSTDNIRAAILASAEFRNMAGSADAGFVGALYQNLLGRNVEADGIKYWSAALDAGTAPTAIVAQIMHSEEASQHVVEALYSDFLHRPGETEGVQALTQAVMQGVTPDQLVAVFATSGEYVQMAIQK